MDIVHVNVHVETVGNLELLRKGYYRVGIRVTCDGVRGTPLSSSAAPGRLTSHSRLVGIDGSGGTDPGAFTDAGSYTTRALLLRFSDEEFDVNEGANYRLELPLQWHARRYGATGALRTISIEATLLRADIPVGASLNGAPAPAAYAPVSTRVAHLRCPSAWNAGHGAAGSSSSTCGVASAWVPIAFDPAYLVVAGMLLHACHVGIVLPHPSGTNIDAAATAPAKEDRAAAGAAGGDAALNGTAAAASAKYGASTSAPDEDSSIAVAESIDHTDPESRRPPLMTVAADTRGAPDALRVDAARNDAADAPLGSPGAADGQAGTIATRAARMRAAAGRWLGGRRAFGGGGGGDDTGPRAAAAVRSGGASLLQPSARVGSDLHASLQRQLADGVVVGSTGVALRAGAAAVAGVAPRTARPPRRGSSTSTDRSTFSWDGDASAVVEVAVAEELPTGSPPRPRAAPPPTLAFRRTSAGPAAAPPAAPPLSTPVAAAPQRRLTRTLAELIFPRWGGYLRQSRRRAAALSAEGVGGPATPVSIEDAAALGPGGAAPPPDSSVAHPSSDHNPKLNPSPTFTPLSAAELQAAHAAWVGPLAASHVSLQRAVSALLAESAAFTAAAPVFDALYAIPPPGVSGSQIDGASAYAAHRFHYGVRCAAAALVPSLEAAATPRGALAYDSSTSTLEVAQWALGREGPPPTPLELQQHVDCVCTVYDSAGHPVPVSPNPYLHPKPIPDEASPNAASVTVLPSLVWGSSGVGEVVASGAGEDAPHQLAWQARCGAPAGGAGEDAGAAAAAGPGVVIAAGAAAAAAAASGSISTAAAAQHFDGFGVAVSGGDVCSGAPPPSAAAVIRVGAPFASRAAAAAAHPDAVARVLELEADAVARPLLALWGQFTRLLPRFRAAASGPLQARYRAAAMATLHASVVASLALPATALLDPSAAVVAPHAPRKAAAHAAAHAAAALVPVDAVTAACADRVALAVRSFSAVALLQHPGQVEVEQPDARIASATLASHPAHFNPAHFNRGPTSSFDRVAYGGGRESPSSTVVTDADAGGGGPPSEGGPSPAPSLSRSVTVAASPRAAVGAVVWRAPPAFRAAASVDAPVIVWPGGTVMAGVVVGTAARVTPPSCAVLPPPPPASRPSGTSHVLLLLNGLGGGAADTRLLRAYLKLHCPHVLLVALASHQGRATEGDIVAAAARVAVEAATQLSTTLPQEGFHPKTVSFLGFSLGGLVLRAALRHPALAPFRSRFRAFISVAAPHLGLVHAPTSLVSAGLFVMQLLRGSHALAQLAMTDGPRGDVRGALLYLLATGWGGGPKQSVSSYADMLDAQRGGNDDAAEREGVVARRGRRRLAAVAAPLLRRLPGFRARQPPLRSATPASEDGSLASTIAAAVEDDGFSDDEDDDGIDDPALDGGGYSAAAATTAGLDGDPPLGIGEGEVESGVNSGGVGSRVDAAIDGPSNHRSDPAVSTPPAGSEPAPAPLAIPSRRSGDGERVADVTAYPQPTGDAAIGSAAVAASRGGGDTAILLPPAAVPGAAGADGDANVRADLQRPIYDARGGTIRRLARVPAPAALQRWEPPVGGAAASASLSATPLAPPSQLRVAPSTASDANAGGVNTGGSAGATPSLLPRTQSEPPPHASDASAATAPSSDGSRTSRGGSNTSRTLAELAFHGFSGESNGALMAAFSRVVLIASAQDAYAPRPSCLAQWGEAALADARRGPPIGEMIRGFFDGVAPASVTRIDVLFRTLGGGGAAAAAARLPTLDSVIGRDAHVAFLESESFAASLALWLAGEAVWE